MTINPKQEFWVTVTPDKMETIVCQEEARLSVEFLPVAGLDGLLSFLGSGF